MLKLRNVTKIYNTDGNLTIGIKNISLDLNINEFVGIIGKSGSGKSTFLNVVSKMIPFEQGEIYFNNEETSFYNQDDLENFRKNNVSYISQENTLIDSYTVYKNIEIPFLLQNISTLERKEKINDILKKVGLEDKKHIKASKLSGGEIKRCIIARALATENKILICDEPVGNIDQETGKKIIKLIKDISKDKLVLYVTHNYDEIKDYITRRLEFFDGKIIEDKKIINIEEKNIINNKNNKFSFKTFFKFLFNNIIMSPKKTILFIFIFLFTIFGLSSIYQAINLDLGLEDYNTTDYNLFDNRVMIAKDTIITNDEIEKLKEIKHVKDIITNDGFLDMKFTTNDYINFYISYKDIYTKEIIYGKNPTDDKEILVSKSLYSRMFDTDYENFYVNRNINILDNDYIISGITEDKSNIVILNSINNIDYFEFYNFFSKLTINISYEKGKSYIHGIQIKFSNDDKIYIPSDFFQEDITITLLKNYDLGNEDINNVISFDNLPIEESKDEYFYFPYNIIKSNYEKDKTDSSNRLSLIIDDDKYFNSVKEKLDGYYVLHHSQNGNALFILVDLITDFFEFIIIFLISILIYYICYYVVSLVATSYIKDYELFKIYGIGKKVLTKVNIAQYYLLMIVSFIIYLIIMIIGAKTSNLNIFHFLKYQEYFKIFILFLLMIYLTHKIINKLNKKVYKLIK